MFLYVLSSFTSFALSFLPFEKEEENAGERSAILYTLVENCRRRVLDPYAYLHDVLTCLPRMTNRQIQEVAPRVTLIPPFCAADDINGLDVDARSVNLAKIRSDPPRDFPRFSENKVFGRK